MDVTYRTHVRLAAPRASYYASATSSAYCGVWSGGFNMPCCVNGGPYLCTRDALLAEGGVYSHNHNYIVYRYTKHTGPIVYSHNLNYIVYRYTKHTGPIVYPRNHNYAPP